MATREITSEKRESFDIRKMVTDLVSKLPARDKVATRLNKIDTILTPFYAVLMAWATYVIGTSFYRYGPTDVVSLEYFTNLYAGLSLVAFAIVLVALFESVRRNEIGDMAKVIVAIAVNYAAMRFNGTWLLMVLAYGFGFSLAHSASRHGKLDWTPLVAYNAAFIGIATQIFGFTAVSVVWPVLMSVVFQAVEVFRNEDYRSVRLAVPGMVVAIAGLVLTMNPVAWILLGALVSFVIAPTAFKLYESKHDKLQDTVKSCGTPCADFDNGMKNLRTNAEAAMLTLVSSCLFVILMVMFS